MLADAVSGESPLPGSQRAVFSLGPCMAERGLWSLPLLIRGPTHMTSFEPNHFPVALFPSTVTWRPRLPHKNFAGTHIFRLQQPSRTLCFSFIYQQGHTAMTHATEQAEEPEEVPTLVCERTASPRTHSTASHLRPAEAPGNWAAGTQTKALLGIKSRQSMCQEE